MAASSLRRLTALALARALLAGPQIEAGLVARLWVCLGTQPLWCKLLGEQLAKMPGEHWQRLSIRSLASWIERHAAYQDAWQGEGDNKPFARRYILREAQGMLPPRLGLEHCQIPSWPHTAALADGLAVSLEGLWRLTLPTAWQRRIGLGEQHYRYRLLAKRSGGWRLLEVPQPYLMALQRRVLDELLDRIPPHEAACGFRRQHSVLDHARTHVGQAVVLRFDLQDFFSTVRASRVQALFKTLGYSDEVACQLSLLCTTATPEPVLQRMQEEKGGLTWQQRQRLRDAHLPQGAPSSAALANLCAFRLDLRLQGLADSLGARYSRYADDLVLSGGQPLRAAADRIEAWVGRIALEEGFALNHRKTRCLPAARRQLVCNIVVNQKPNLPRAEFDLLKAILHRCSQDGPAAQNREGKPDWRAHLQGRVAWAAQLNPSKAQRLQALLDKIDWGR